MRLVASHEPGEATQELLTEATREFVQAFDQYAAAWESRFNGRQSRKKYWLATSLFVQLKLARDEYYKRAGTSSDPVHRHVATLLENSGIWVPQANSAAARMLRNWLRDEPRMETYPADSWVTAIAPRVDFAQARTIVDATLTLSFELKARLPQPGVLCIDVGTDVISASVYLVADPKASSGRIDAIWKKGRIWVMLGEARLGTGDLVNVRVSAAERISRPATVRIAAAASSIVTTASR